MKKSSVTDLREAIRIFQADKIHTCIGEDELVKKIEEVFEEEHKSRFKQLLEFMSRWIKSLPFMDPQIMQGWIENPEGLEKLQSQ